MGKPKQVSLTSEQLENLEEEIENEYILDPIEEAEEQEEVALQSAIAQFRGESGAKMFMYRMDGKGKSGEFIDSFGVSDYTHDELLEKLRDEYYGGEFKLQIRDGNGRLKMNQKVRVVKSEPPKEEPKQDNNNGADNIVALIAAMNKSGEEASRRSEQNINAMMTLMMKGQTEAAQSQTNMLLKMMEINSNKPEPKNDQPTMGDIMAMMVSMKELTADKDKQDPMDILIKGMELGQNSAGGEENMLQTTLKTLGPAISGMTNQMAQQQVRPHAPQTLVPQTQTQLPPDSAPVVKQPPITEEKEKEDMNLVLLAKLAPYTDMLLSAAKNGHAADTYANMVMDQMDLPTVKGFVIDDANYEKLFQYVPGAEPYRHWFDELRKILIQFIKEDEAEEKQRHVYEPPTPDGPETSPPETSVQDALKPNGTSKHGETVSDTAAPTQSPPDTH